MSRNDASVRTKFRRSKFKGAAVGAVVGVCSAGAACGMSAGQTSQAGAPGKVPVQATAPAVASAPIASSAPAAAPTTAQTVEDSAKAYKAQQLIGRVEQTYRSGVENYRAGHLEAARADFDSAVDQMLTSGLDLKSDPQLSDEFEHLLDAVNSLEIAALKQGNGLSPAIEAAPLDAADEVTFPPNAALTAQLAAELKTTQSDFPLVVNDYVAGFINYFANSSVGTCSSAALARARWQVQGHDLADSARRRSSAGPDLSCGGRVRLSAAGARMRARAREACGSSCRSQAPMD